MPRPLFFTLDPSIGTLVKSGDCKLCIAPGDSINGMSTNPLMKAMMRRWRPNKLVGINCLVSSVNADGLGSVFDSGGGVFAATERFPGGFANTAATGPNGRTAYSVTESMDFVYSSGSFVAEVNNLTNTVMNGLTPDTAANAFYVSDIAGGDGLGNCWLMNKTPTCTLIAWQATNGANTGLKLDAWWGAYTTFSASSGSFSLRGTEGLVSKTVTMAATNAASVLSFRLRGIGNTQPAAGDNAIIQSVLVKTGEVGLQLDNLAVGGTGLYDYWDASTGGTHWFNYVSQATWTAYHAIMGTNVFLYMIGQNDVGGLNKAAYKARILARMVVDRVAVPTAKFILVAPYDTGAAATQATSDYADALYEIAQADSGCLFINLRDMLGHDANLYQSIPATWLANVTYFPGDIVQSPPNAIGGSGGPGTLSLNGSTNVLTRSAGNFGAEGLVVGMSIILSGFTNGVNNGSWILTNVGTTTVTLNPQGSTLITESGTGSSAISSGTGLYYACKSNAFLIGAAGNVQDPSTDTTHWTGPFTNTPDQNSFLARDRNAVLADGVHPNEQGKVAIADAIWSGIECANAVNLDLISKAYAGGNGPLVTAVDSLRTLISNIPYFQTWTGTASPAAALNRIFVGEVGYPIFSAAITGGVLTVHTREPNFINVGDIITIEGAALGHESSLVITGPQTVTGVGGTLITIATALPNLTIVYPDQAFVVPCIRPLAVICEDHDGVHAQSIGVGGVSIYAGTLEILLEADVTAAYSNDARNALTEARSAYGQFMQGLGDNQGTVDLMPLNKIEPVSGPEFTNSVSQDDNRGRFERWRALVRVTWGLEG